MLDYIYRNEPSGKLGLGKWLDRRFISHPGWAAIRTRRHNLEKLLSEAIQERKGPLRLIDIASGPASYILSALEKARPGVEAICQDIEPRWIEEGRKAALKKGLSNVLFQEGNAFDAKALLEAKPHIAISSGFYDWINDSSQIQSSIRSVHAALEPKGAFILTVQTDHPNLSFVQGVFSDFNHEPLKMTMRSAQDVVQWLEKAGFRVEKTLRDPYCYYAVFKAVKQ
jgi:ubiquinone/menaquinone biosynthesis C-methylase UbiE